MKLEKLLYARNKKKCVSLIKQYKKMINFDDVVKVNIKEHNPKMAQISNNTYGILVTGGSGSGKTNSSFNLMSDQPDTDRIYMLFAYELAYMLC